MTSGCYDCTCLGRLGMPRCAPSIRWLTCRVPGLHGFRGPQCRHPTFGAAQQAVHPSPKRVIAVAEAPTDGPPPPQPTTSTRALAPVSTIPCIR